MKIAIASDLHDNTQQLEWFLKECQKREITHCYFLGDLIRPTLAKKLFEQLQTHYIFGNNDGDKVRILKFQTTNTTIANDCFDEITDQHVFLTHYPLLARNAAESGRYKAVFYGHDHQKHEEHIGDCLLVNPGELAGHLTGIVSFYVWDQTTNTGEFITRPNTP